MGKNPLEGTVVVFWRFERKIILSKGKTIVRVGSEDNPALVINHKSGNKVLKLFSEVQVTEKST